MDDPHTTSGPDGPPREDANVDASRRTQADVLIRIEAPHFVAGIEARDGRVVRTAPILAYMLGWDGARVAQYAKRRGWTWQRL
jgi:hypothetical protein